MSYLSTHLGRYLLTYSILDSSVSALSAPDFLFMIPQRKSQRLSILLDMLTKSLSFYHAIAILSRSQGCDRDNEDGGLLDILST